jgi:gamma-glutamylcyclotransferase (GGCT)/AIG2-like uncharacterized protein YtfP
VPDYLFAYGTLRPALWPEVLRPVLAGLRCLGEATVAGRMYDLGAHPCAVFDASGRIRGDVLELPSQPEVLAALDAYEDFDPADHAGSLFLRLRCEARLDDGRVLLCWMYAYNRDPGSAIPVPDGDYLRWRAEQKGS